MWVFILTALLLFVPVSSFAHDTADPAIAQAILMPAEFENARSRVWTEGIYTYVEANGIPNHATGNFPNPDNPNAISLQNYRFRFFSDPHKAEQITQLQAQPFGVAVNGIPFDPSTAECFGKPRGAPPQKDCEWREEAIKDGRGLLGLDSSNAHVQPGGAYHYHGIPHVLVSISGDEDLVHVGYAADGFEIYVSRSGAYRSSYRLKRGKRLGKPGGVYDGTYTQDFVFMPGAGDLDECNGVHIPEKGYVYVLTKAFPFVPRCWVGSPDKSFERPKLPHFPPNSGPR